MNFEFWIVNFELKIKDSKSKIFGLLTPQPEYSIFMVRLGETGDERD